MIDLPNARPLHASWTVRLAALVLLAMVVVGGWTSDARGQDGDDGAEAPPARIVAVDAVGTAVGVELIGLDPDTPASSVELLVEGEAVSASSVSTTTAEGRTAEIVLVVDAHVRGAAGDLVAAITEQLQTATSDSSSSTSIAVVSAGDGALILSHPTTDRDRTLAALDEVSFRNSSALYSAVERGAGLFTDDPTTVKTMIVAATGADEGSTVTSAEGQAALLQRGAQLITVGFQGSDNNLEALSNQTAGLTYQTTTVEALKDAVAAAMVAAEGRTVVGFEPGELAEARTTVAMTVADQSFDFSYPADVRTVNPLQLAPEAKAGSSSFALFQTSAGLYLALLLAFVGISLGVWSLGSIVAGGEAGLEGVLARYTEDGEVTEAEVEDMVVQSALLQRAVEVSESFAERQGFLSRVEELLERANLPVRPGEGMFILGAIVFLSSMLGLVVTRSVLAALIFGVFAVAVTFFIVRYLGARRLKTFESQLPDTLQLLSGTLRAGYSLPQGLEAVSNEIADPMGQELRRAMTEARLGRDMEDALTGIADRMSSPDFAWTVMAIGIQREVGGNLNELLMSVSDTMVARDRLKREISALTAEGKMSAGVLSFLPPGLGAIMWIINPEYISVLFTETMGNVLLGLGVLSATVGLAWMKKVITVDV
ncbi:MAG: type II secretion system F family protein [Actinomycetota bacterium]